MTNYNFSDMRKPAIFTAQSYGTKTTVEIDHSDLSLDEVMDAFQTLLVGMGYHHDTFKQWVLERAAEYQEEDGHAEIEHTNSHWNYVKAAMEQDEEGYENLRHSTDEDWEKITNMFEYPTPPNENLKKKTKKKNK